MNSDFDAVVVGAGFAGAATAYHLSRLGDFRILILEKESAPGCHASGKNAALLRQAVANAEVAGFVQETLRALEAPPEDWERKNIYRRCGSVLIGESSVLSGFADTMKKAGTDFSLHGRDSFPENLDAEFRESLSATDYEALLFTPRDGVVDIAGLLANYLDAARAHGAELRCGAGASGLRRAGEGWTLEVAGRTLRARALVNAAGAWAGEVGMIAGAPNRGLASFRRHLFIAAQPASPPDRPFFWDARHEFYFRPDPEGLLLCAGDEDPYGARAPEVDSNVQARLIEKLRAHFPAMAIPEIRRAWACLRTFSQGAPFLIEEEASTPGYFWVAGLGGHGMGSSFGAGRRAAERVAAFLNRQKT